MTFMTPYPLSESVIESPLIPLIRNRKRMFVEYLSHYPKQVKPLMIQRIVTFMTLDPSYIHADTQTRRAEAESQSLPCRFSFGFSVLPGDSE